ncbi:hypothetical protein [Kutzneria kofuensis]|uniref:hypothetical protein n=1 Tax=Kutzneria kofuensis TaxID=103725 RepID=UPI0031E4ECF1
MTLPLGVTGVIIPVLAAEPLLGRPGVPPRVVEAHAAGLGAVAGPPPTTASSATTSNRI